MKQSICLNSNELKLIAKKRSPVQALMNEAASLAFNFWQRFSVAFSQKNEPRIWQSKRKGKTVWHAYDPNTGDSAVRSSELEMLIWLEERYYQ